MLSATLVWAVDKQALQLPAAVSCRRGDPKRVTWAQHGRGLFGVSVHAMPQAALLHLSFSFMFYFLRGLSS